MFKYNVKATILHSVPNIFLFYTDLSITKSNNCAFRLNLTCIKIYAIEFLILNVTISLISLSISENYLPLEQVVGTMGEFDCLAATNVRASRAAAFYRHVFSILSCATLWASFS